MTHQKTAATAPKAAPKWTAPVEHTAQAFAFLFGPNEATTPAGHPIMIGSGNFDSRETTPQDAIAKAANRFQQVPIDVTQWEIEFEADVTIAPTHPIAVSGRVRHSKVFFLRYLHADEAATYAKRKLAYTDVHNPMKTSWYLPTQTEAKTFPAKVTKDFPKGCPECGNTGQHKMSCDTRGSFE